MIEVTREQSITSLDTVLIVALAAFIEQVCLPDTQNAALRR